VQSEFIDMERQTKRLRFSYSDDLMLLKEFLYKNPTKDREILEKIQNHLQQQIGKYFLIKTLKNHLFLLLDAFIKKDNSDQKSKYKLYKN